jgi:enamine deaminase RidA (YjgF/YER057c/UK114 family)
VLAARTRIARPSNREHNLPGIIMKSVVNPSKEQVMRIERLNPAGVHTPTVYTHAVTVGDARLAFISGQIALDEDNQLVGEGDLRAQATQAFANLKGILESLGADFSHVLKLTMYIANYRADEHLSIIREVLARYVADDERPANTLVGVQALAQPALMIEVEAVAAIE